MVEVADSTRGGVIVTCCFGFLATMLMLLRLLLRRRRGQNFELSDYLTMAAIFCTICRISFTSTVLLYGNNNLTAAARAGHVFTDQEIFERTVGSKLGIADRGFYNTYLWLQKAVVLLLYKRILAGLPWPQHVIHGYWVVLFLTQLALQVSTFTECQPFYLYWQVVPDPGTCVHAVVEQYTLVITNIFTDVMLILLPMPYIFRIKRSLILRFQLAGLFSIGIGLIVIALCRLPAWGSTTSQFSRSTLGPTEGFLSAFVANVPTLFTLRSPHPPSSTLNTRKSSNVVTTSGTQNSYMRDKFRQNHSVKDDQIIVTHDIEMVSNKGSIKEEIFPDEIRPDQDSVEELIR